MNMLDKALEALEGIESAVADISYNLDPVNSFGTTLGDQVYELTYEVKRIADVLEALLEIAKTK